AAGVRNRHAIDDEERLIVTSDRVGTTNDDARRSALSSRARDLHAGNFSLELLDQVDRFGLVELRARELLLRGADLALFSLYSQTGNDRCRQLGSHWCEMEIGNNSISGERYGQRARGVSDSTRRDCDRLAAS